MTTAEPVTVIVADDHPFVLEGVRSLLAQDPALTVLATLSDGGAVLEAIRALSPAIAVLDRRMPGLSGLDVLGAVRAEGLGTRIVFLSASMEDEHIYAAITEGAAGIVLKESAPETLLQCLRAVAAGHHWYPEEVVGKVLEREAKRRADGIRLARQLTSREREIVLLVARGLSNKEIARELNITDGTAKLHLHNIYQKLGVFKRASLSDLALQHSDLLR